MKQISKQERFYLDLGEAMFMNNMRGFINTETLEVEIYPEADYFFDEEDTAHTIINKNFAADSALLNYSLISYGNENPAGT